MSSKESTLDKLSNNETYPEPLRGTSELGVEVDAWLGSEEGKTCKDVWSLVPLGSLTLLPGRKYLENRLRAAFLAGAKANDKVVSKMFAEGYGLGLRDTAGGFPEAGFTEEEE